MAQIVYRGNLSAKSFPFITDFQGQTVIVGGPDQNFNRSLTSSEDVDKDVGIPTLIYGHNIIPQPFGFSSIGYDTQIPAYSTPTTAFTECQVITANALAANTPGPQVFFSPIPAGSHFVFKQGSTVWSQVGAAVPYTAGKLISYALVQGITYIFIANQGCYKYDSASNLLVAVTLTALAAANIIGITSYQGYMIAWDQTHVYWSSVLDIDYTLNSVDFTPSLATDAGSLTVDGIKGTISFILAASFGLTVYTAQNAVSSIYSGNPRYPFAFKEIVASGGCTTVEHVAYDANTGNQFAYTTSGFQAIASVSAQTIFPELTDFLGGADFEDFNESTLLFSSVNLSAPLLKKITSVSDRYLIISYGITELTHAILYDMAQKRYGKFKTTHVDCFEYKYLDPTQSDAPRRSIAFLKKDGTIQTVNPSVTLATSRGVIVLGKFQYVRSRNLMLEGVTLQTVHPNQSVSSYIMSSITGGTLDSCTTTALYETTVGGDAQREYLSHVVGKNHCLLLVGGFFLSSFVLRFHNHGRR